MVYSVHLVYLASLIGNVRRWRLAWVFLHKSLQSSQDKVLLGAQVRLRILTAQSHIVEISKVGTCSNKCGILKQASINNVWRNLALTSKMATLTWRWEKFSSRKSPDTDKSRQCSLAGGRSVEFQSPCQPLFQERWVLEFLDISHGCNLSSQGKPAIHSWKMWALTRGWVTVIRLCVWKQLHPYWWTPEVLFWPVVQWPQYLCFGHVKIGSLLWANHTGLF